MKNNKVGRPRIEINYEVLDALLQFKTTKKFCAHHMGMSEDTLENRLMEDHGMTFTEYHEMKISNISAKLQQKALNMAFNGNTVMMIFALKNLSKWTDKQEISHSVANNYEAQLRKLEEEYERGKQTFEVEYKEAGAEYKGAQVLNVGMEDEQDGPKEIGSLPYEVGGASDGQEGDD